MTGAALINGYTRLMLAAEAGDLTAARDAAEAEPGSLAATTADGRNALMLAAAAGHADVVRLLDELSQTLRISVAAAARGDPAAERVDANDAEQGSGDENTDDESTVEAALRVLPEPKRASMRSTLTAMQPAAREVVLRKLLQAAPRAAAASKQTTREAMSASEGTRAEVFGLLAGADVQGNNALHLAAFRGQVSVVALLLRRGQPPVTGTNHEGLTALHFAAERGQAEAMRLLLSTAQGAAGAAADAAAAAAAVAATTRSGMTPLHKASRAPTNAPTLRVLLEFGADPFRCCAGGDGLNAFHFAAAAGRPETLSLLFEQRDTVNAGASTVPDPEMTTALGGKRLLHLAAGAGEGVTVEALWRQHGCRLDAVDARGRTALMYAAMGGYAELCRSLCDWELEQQQQQQQELQSLPASKMYVNLSRAWFVF